MKTDFFDGGIITEANFFERTGYDVGNLILNARFDGFGGIERYAVINKFEAFDALRTLMSVNGVPLNFAEKKTVEMIGRRMTVSLSLPDVDIKIRQFLTEKDNAVITRIGLTAKSDCVFETVINFGVHFTSYIEQFFMSRFGAGTIFKAAKGLIKKHKRIEDRVLKNDLLGDFYIDFASNYPIIPMEENKFFINQFKVRAALFNGETANVDIVTSSGTRRDFSECNSAELVARADAEEAMAEEYIRSLKRFKPSFGETEKALYVSCLNCAISNYKERGDFKGFLAGLVYQFPARTYFRDAYWTVQPVLNFRPELVRNEILTLARGISKDGTCPSAVKWNFKSYWGDHYDSPSFFAMMIYDYVERTKDVSVLSETIKKRGTVLELAIAAIKRLRTETDETGLLVKRGRYNRRDWCDNVFRTGYASYDEALYARALYCLSKLSSFGGDNEKASEYFAEYERVKTAINDLLWDDRLGYFINYKDGERVEDNLSIDTVVIALFDLTSDERKIRMLKNMERLLESKNNGEQCAGDFGTLSVYPFYKHNDDVVQKSSFPYYYHNGGDWPYLSAAYAYAKRRCGLDYSYPLTRWFLYNVERGNMTPVEFFSPCHPDGSLMQAWSAMGAYVLD